MTKEQLIEKWQGRLEAIVDPDNMTWDDLGFTEPPEGYEDKEVFDYLKDDPEGDMSMEDQIELKVVEEVLEDLRQLK